jgi:hypothetical protein
MKDQVEEAHMGLAESYQTLFKKQELLAKVIEFSLIRFKFSPLMGLRE